MQIDNLVTSFVSDNDKKRAVVQSNSIFNQGSYPCVNFLFHHIISGMKEISDRKFLKVWVN